MRNRLSINLEQAIAEGCLITTDSNGDAFYYPPNDPYKLLMFNGVSVEWTFDIRVNNITMQNMPGSDNRVLSLDIGGNVTPYNPLMKYDLMYSDSGAPIGVPLVGAGAGALVIITGTHRAGIVELRTGNSALQAGAQFRIDYRGILYPNGSAVSLTPYNGAAAAHAIDIFAQGSGANFSVGSNVNLGANNSYQWNYIVEGF